jgi:UDP-glucose 4-epimerase
MGCPQACGEIFNVGATEEVTILDLARRVIATTRSASTIELVPYAEAYAPGFDDMQRRRPDVGKLRRTVGFAPGAPLEGLIAETVQAIRGARQGG